VYFWLEGDRNSWLKVRSSVIRLVKRAFQANGISMPDAAREIVFPAGVPIRRIAGDEREAAAMHGRSGDERDTAATKAEGGLHSEAGMIEQQARRVRAKSDEENLLEPESGESDRDDPAKDALTGDSA
jgi:hypothetical protein